ncbi:putative quinol monooxygenase [Roseicyclus persicicus]|uniref:Antibiotic biosynthesis monooxygenase n=1 Tax=Roseicyclus persicicus TaxID=2650661 RepID=A0A7X6JZF5_9RHOB|nr:putative quinol monooxygenase [Roseibacterium persicicum]NKX44758.1 antibiotic biosynthesis monooxygenase [Roseibacterium persicicum]
MYVVTVSLTAVAGRAAELRAVLAENAARSVADEPGCRRFDVCETEGAPGRFFLYELYDDRAAFDSHLATPHYAVFRDRSAALVQDKEVQTHVLDPR